MSLISADRCLQASANCHAFSLPGNCVQEEVVREAESKQALLTEAAQNTGNEAQRQEDVSSGQVRRLLDAALRHRMNDQTSSPTPQQTRPTA